MYDRPADERAIAISRSVPGFSKRNFPPVLLANQTVVRTQFFGLFFFYLCRRPRFSNKKKMKKKNSFDKVRQLCLIRPMLLREKEKLRVLHHTQIYFRLIFTSVRLNPNVVNAFSLISPNIDFVLLCCGTLLLLRTVQLNAE